MIGLDVVDTNSTLQVSDRSSRAPVVRPLRLEVMAVSLTIHVLALALPLALLQIYDRILPAQAYGTATFLIIGVGVAIVLEALLRCGRLSLFVDAAARYEADAIELAMLRLQTADVNVIERSGTAAVTEAIRAIGQVRDFWSGQAGAALYELPFVAVYLLLIAHVGGWLAAIPLLLFLLAMIIAWCLNFGIRDLAAKVETAEHLRRDLAWTSFAAIHYVKGVGAEGIVGNVWSKANRRLMGQSVELETRMGWIRENAALFGQLSTVLIVSVGAGMVVAGELTTGALAACTMLAGRSIGPAMASLGYWTQLARVSETQKKVEALLGLPVNRTFGTSEPNLKLTVTSGRMRIDAPLIFDTPLEVEPGDVVYLDTRDTSIASDLLTAISGLGHDPKVSVRVDGHLPVDFGIEEYSKGVMLVTRQLALVPGTILDNLTLYNPTLNERARGWCERLGLQMHLDKLRHGVLTDVGTSTAEHLDEGIYQRIAIVRALIREPKVLLLDHAASGMDIDGVKRLGEVLKELKGKTTVLVSSYKEPLVEACTRRIALKGTAQ